MKQDATTQGRNNVFGTAAANYSKLKKLVIIQLIIIVIFLLLKPNYFQILCLTTIITTIMSIYANYKARTTIKFKQYIKTLTKNLLTVSALYYLFTTFNKYGVWGFLLVILLYSAFILIKNRKQYIETINTIFAMIWGKKPNEFKKGELKNTKIKLRWNYGEKKKYKKSTK